MNTVKILLGIILLAFIFDSCDSEDEEAFAYGNFETVDLILSAETSGKILQFSLEEGNDASKDVMLVLIDTTQLALKKQQAEAARAAISTRIVQINEEINVNKVSLQNVLRELKRVKALYAKNAATQKQLDEVQGQADITRAKTRALESQKKLVYAEMNAQDLQIQQLADQIDKCFVRSPISGRVLETYANQGELAVPGKALLKMADLSEMMLRVYIDGDQLSTIKLGQKVDVIFDAPGGELKQIQGKVSWISSQAEFTPKIIQTREERVNLVYAVKVHVPNDGSIKIGMPGEIALINDNNGSD